MSRMSKGLNHSKLYLSVGIGGMIGATLRYSVSLLFANNILFPYDTLFVNLIGCFILSYLLHQDLVRRNFKPEIFTGSTTGIIGSFTTFSTFSVEVVSLFHSSISFAIFYIIISIVGGIFLCYIGYLCATKRQESK